MYNKINLSKIIIKMSIYSSQPRLVGPEYLVDSGNSSSEFTPLKIYNGTKISYK